MAKYFVRGWWPDYNDYVYYSPSRRFCTLVFTVHLARRFGSRSEAKRFKSAANAYHGDLDWEVVEAPHA